MIAENGHCDVSVMCGNKKQNLYPKLVGGGLEEREVMLMVKLLNGPETQAIQV